MRRHHPVLGIRRHRQHEAEHGAPRLAVELDDAAVVADDFGDQRQPEAGAPRSGGDEGIEQVGTDVVGDALAVVLNADHERQVDARAAARHGETDAVPVGGGEDDLAAVGGHGFGRVLHQVEEDLHQFVPVAEHRRQGRVVGLDEAHVAGEAVPRQAMHPVQDPMDVDGGAWRRSGVGEHFHAVDKGTDAIRLVPDEPGQVTVLGGSALFEQLGRALNSRQRVLDLVGEHGRHARDRARCAAVTQPAVDSVGDGPFVQGQHNSARLVAQRGRLDVD